MTSISAQAATTLRCDLSRQVVEAGQGILGSLLVGVGNSWFEGGMISRAEMLEYLLKKLAEKVADPQVERLLSEYRDAIAHRPQLGVNVKTEFGAGHAWVVVTKVESVAVEAGLHVDDVIVSINSRKVETGTDFVDALRDTPSDSSSSLEVVRTGARHLITLTTSGYSSLVSLEGRMLRCFAFLDKVFAKIAMNRRYAVLSSQMVPPPDVVHVAPSPSPTQEPAEESPQYILGNAYIRYIHVRRCYQGRLGYGAIYISDAELEVARHAVHELQQKYRDDLGVDAKTGAPWTTDTMWSKANEIANSDTAPVNRELCQRALDYLLRSYRKHLPERAITPKDF